MHNTKTETQHLLPLSNAFDYTNDSGFKIILALVCSIFSVLVLIIFQPFGINNYQHELSVTLKWLLVVSSFGLTTFTAFIFNEFVIRRFVFNNISKIKLILWFSWEIMLVGSCNFIYYNFLGGFKDMKFQSLVMFLINNIVVLFVPIIGTLFYFRYRQLKKEYYDILQFSNHKTEPDDLILISGDYKKDKIALSPAKILSIKSQDNYVELNYLENTGKKKHLIRFTLSNMEKALNHDYLIRCNRSIIANLSKVESAKKKSGNLYVKLINTDEEIKVSKKFESKVNAYLNDNLESISTSNLSL